MYLSSFVKDCEHFTTYSNTLLKFKVCQSYKKFSKLTQQKVQVGFNTCTVVFHKKPTSGTKRKNIEDIQARQPNTKEMVTKVQRVLTTSNKRKVISFSSFSFCIQWKSCLHMNSSLNTLSSMWSKKPARVPNFHVLVPMMEKMVKSCLYQKAMGEGNNI